MNEGAIVRFGLQRHKEKRNLACIITFIRSLAWTFRRVIPNQLTSSLYIMSYLK